MKNTYVIILLFLISIFSYSYYANNYIPDDIISMGESSEIMIIVSLITSVVSLITAVIGLTVKIIDMKK